ncbi:M64 family metallopeptidase [Streptomyces sp. NBC_00083]|uniref:M64 family metallopeptidase n=1 Tax=Streptomyces sp. NBC_00083 TaxID=2975647 RepID=UPI00225AE61A|nr:M64 family metallopeptidase [Streptomyces sp. NBC_00083]MCX5385893.1 M64 family metallopeptidase [Streptomyces sp. NBC_00083]
MRPAMRRSFTARRSIATATLAGATVLAALAAGPGTAAAAGSPPPQPKVEVEIPGPEAASGATPAGSGHTLVPKNGLGRPAPHLSASASASATAAGDGQVTKVVDNGSTADRLDIVIVGDGYTADQLDQFHADAKEKWGEITGVEPYTTYQNLFNVWTVDAVSAQSGVSGDPAQGDVKNTALGSYFWCDGVERLLCVDQDKVDAYVAKAPQADLVVVLSNSAKYGGAGYNEPSKTLGYEGISTASAGNAKSGQVAIHETGHSLGKLADEYFYPDTPGYEHYDGPEAEQSNISVLSAEQMAADRTKWYRWLGETSPDGGTVGAYEGGGYYVTGLNRPTDGSIMRILGKPFNLPGVEAMIAGFYRHASVVTPLTPTARTLRPSDTARVAVPRLAGARQLTVRWYLDGRELRRYEGRTAVSVRSLGLGRGDHRLTVRVLDRTPSVRDPAIAKTLQDTAEWPTHR